MTCNCRSDIQEKLLNRFKEQSPDAKNHEAKLTGYAYLFGARVQEKGVMTIEVTADHPLKKGGYKAKTEKSNMIFTFCPFCGKKYDEEVPS